MGRITVADNPFEPKATYQHQWSGTVLQYLEEEFPQGFAGDHRLYINGQILPPERYGNTVLEPEDEARLLLLPGIPPAIGAAVAGWVASAGGVGALVTGAVLSTAASLAINFVFSKLFPTPTQKDSSVETPQAGSVYSLTSPSNVAALGAPIPAIYGRVLTTPKARQPALLLVPGQ